MRRIAPLAVAALTACAAPQIVLAPRAPPPVAAARPAEGGALLVAEAEMALARQDSEAAVQLAELSVAASPRLIEPRAILARSYAAAGRFDAAIRTWDVLLALTPQAAPALLGRALSLLAAGNQHAAIAALDQMGPSGDVGLAYALAGNPRGIGMLEAAATAPGATARVRQNLALAHALSGDWTGARTIAATDLPAAAIPTRLSEWQRIASAAPPVRVAMLLGVRPAAPVAMAPKPAMPIIVPPRIIVAPAPPPAPMTVALTASSAPASQGWVVQLGAYRTAAEADTAWTALRDLAPLKVQRTARRPAQGLLRVSVASYPDRLSAQRLCVRVKQAGADCFVRLGGAPSRVA